MMATNKDFRGLLKLSVAQRNTIDSMFAGPIQVLRCLAAYGMTIKTIHEASIFLLAHRTEIFPYMAGNRDATLEMLKELVVYLSNETPEYLTLTLRQWSISMDGSVRLSQFGLDKLRFHKNCDLNYFLEISGPCTASLEHHGKDIFFSIEFQRKVSNLTNTASVDSKNKHSQKKSSALRRNDAINIKKCDICHKLLSPNHWIKHANLLKLIPLDYQPRITAADVGLGSGGSIWAFSGGLPSLGRSA